MTDRMHNIILGLILFSVSVVWSWLVIDSIPAGFGDGDIGARAFPLMFGLCLGFLSTLLLLKAVFGKANVQTKLDVIANSHSVIQWLPAGLILVEIVAYGYLLKTCGFVIATPIVVLFVMLVNLRIRSIKLISGMSIGITLTCWLIFEKALGIYLANGSWINLG
ncbi:MAG: tripartite tricarboxylate transporter TctB family protein [Paracoccaceae bacterium]|nr:tripartite tricarboxylate transporter TctB family protein [Paracoccaceae bacterium]